MFQPRLEQDPEVVDVEAGVIDLPMRPPSPRDNWRTPSPVPSEPEAVVEMLPPPDGGPEQEGEMDDLKWQC